MTDNTCIIDEAEIFTMDSDISQDYFKLLDSGEKVTDEIVRKSKTYAQDAWGRFKVNPLAMFGLVMLAIIALFAIFAPIFSQYDYSTQNRAIGNLLPSAEHWFGTDKFGRDLFIRCMYGARISLMLGFSAAIINFFIGVFYGGISGYFGGKVDLVMMRIVDVLAGIPSLCIVITVMMFLGSNIQSILIAISFTFWIGTARIVRGQVLSLKTLEYVLAAKTIGESDFTIIRNHLIPNCLGSIIVSVTFIIPSAIFQEAFLSFIGIGIQLPMASLGSLANDAIRYISSYSYQIIFPSLLISCLMFSLNFIGDGLRDSLDPKLKK